MFAPKIIKICQVTIDNVGNAFQRISVHLNSYFVSFVFPR